MYFCIFFKVSLLTFKTASEIDGEDKQGISSSGPHIMKLSIESISSPDP